jgi:hypothetical protein
VVAVAAANRPGPDPSTWEVLRGLERLEVTMSEQFAAVTARLDSSDARFYSRDYVDGQAAGIAARLAGFDLRHAEDARVKDRRRWFLMTAGVVQALATLGTVTTILAFHTY